MRTDLCPVRKLAEDLSRALSSVQITYPRSKEITESILELVDDISSGRGKTGHIQTVESLARMLSEDRVDRVGTEIGRMVSTVLRKHRPIFLSHIDVHYCPSGKCTILAPAPCQLACPAGVDVPSYVALVGMGRYEEALEVLREDLSFPGTLGRICIHPCEKACRRGEVDEPIAICQLKRVAFDKAYEKEAGQPLPTSHRFKDKIAIIGSGPAGLSTGYFLARTGYRPVIFESMPEPGGMLRWGIPAYRLPRQILQTEINHIKALGVEIHTNVTFGKDITYDSLKNQGFEAVFVGVGAWSYISIPVEGAEGNPNIIDCLAFLRNEHLRKSMVGRRLIIIGGGNVAIDCVRTALRLGRDEVHLVYRRSKQEMPAMKEEIEAAEEEGATFTFLSSPVRVHSNDGTLTGLECIRNTLSEPDSTGRRRPIPVEGSEYIIPADTIIPAIGQKVDMVSLKNIKGLELSRNQLLVVDPETMETTIPGVFAGGDVVTGPATVVEAVASGKKAAQAIHRFLRELPYSEYGLLPARRQRVPVMEMHMQDRSLHTRPDMPRIDVEDRHDNFEEVELCLTAEDASRESKRCLRCDICISCGRCIEVCRDQMQVEAIHLSYVTDNATEDTDLLRPAERCIGCGSCAINCPTNAISAEERNGERRISMCGAEMSRHKLVPCASCGTPFIPERHLDFIREKTGRDQEPFFQGNLCPACARKAGAENFGRQSPVY